jgi:uncharacterized damage-inducible protein DinB
VSVREGLRETIAQFSDDDLSYVPFEGAFSVGQIMLHIAHEEEIELGYGLIGEPQDFPPAPEPSDYRTREAIEALLAEVHAGTERYLRGLDDAALDSQVEARWGETYQLLNMVLHVIEHDIHHRGELSLLLGILGRGGFQA